LCEILLSAYDKNVTSGVGNTRPAGAS